MRIHPAGYIVILVITILVLSLLFVLNLIFPVQAGIHYFLYIVAAVFLFYVVRFFRWPERPLKKDANLIFSSADGNVVAIEEVVETEYFNEKRLQVSVFMSVVNVHVNWYPIAGKVKYNQHKPGKFYPAYLPKSAEENERNSLVVEDAKGRQILVRQIAGLVARRIIAKAKIDEEVEQGGVLGMIKFGSRVDLFLPLDAKVMVNLNQVVRGNKTVIAKFK